LSAKRLSRQFRSVSISGLLAQSVSGTAQKGPYLGNQTNAGNFLDSDRPLPRV